MHYWLVGLSNWTLCCSSRVILNKRICKCSGYISTLSSAEAHCVDQNSRQSAGGRMEGSGSGHWPTNSPIVGLQKRGRKERVNTDVIVGGWCWTLFCPGMKTHSCTQQTCKHTSTTLINNSLLLHLESNKCHFLVGGKRKPCGKTQNNLRGKADTAQPLCCCSPFWLLFHFSSRHFWKESAMFS